jgi:pimeloyl-ACP methyl ester carboxylesterase
MPYLTLAGLQMYYEEYGNSGRLPLLLLHGFTSTGAFWSNQLEAFGAQYRLIIPDLRGHGRTNNPAGRSAMNHRQFARDIIALCRALQIQQAIFCGESTGAMLLLSLVLFEPTLASACILAGGTYYYSDELRAWMRQQSIETMDPTGERGQAMQAAHTALGPDHWRTVATDFFALADHAHRDDFPEPEELRTVQMPILIVHGDRDHFFPVEVPTELYRLLPNAELCILPNTGHTPPAEHPVWFNAIALDFLARYHETNN